MSASLKKRIRKLGAAADKLMDQAADRIEELEREQRDLKTQFTVGRGELVYALIHASRKAFADETDGSDYELFSKLMSCVGPRCLLWMDIKAADAAELEDYIDGEHEDAESIEYDVVKLERVKAMLEETIKRLKSVQSTKGKKRARE